LAAVTNLSARILLVWAIWISALGIEPGLAANNLVVAKAHLQRGHDYFDQKKYKKAHDEFSAALKLCPNNGEILGYLGFTENNRKHYGKAIEYFSKALKLNHSDPKMVYEGRGHAYIQKGNFEAALKDFDKAISLGRPAKTMTYPRGAALVFLHRNEEGLKLLDVALAEHLENRAIVQEMRGKALYELNRYKLAIAAVTDSLAHRPNNPDTLFVRGLSYFKIGEKQKAVDDLAEAIKIFRDSNRNSAAASAEAALADVMRM